MIGLCMCVYFGYHFVQGDRGVFRYVSLQSQIKVAKQERDALVDVKNNLEQRVAMLRPESLNKDFLEERASVVLGLRDSNEMVVSSSGS